MILSSPFRVLPGRTRAAGFTLVELMITVAIVGILLAIALPSYKNYIRRGQQPEAFNALSDYRTKMEQYYQDNRNYGTGSTACASASTAGAWNTFMPAGAKNFAYSCLANTTAGDITQQSYTITATGVAGQVNGDKYTIDQNGNRTTLVFQGTTLSPAAQCWLTSSSSC